MPSQLPAPVTGTLTPKMIRFADHFVNFGGRHGMQGRAAVMAGYQPSGADAVASRLLRRPDVLAYLRHVAESRIKASVIASTEYLAMLRDDPEAPPAERRKAASELLDRAGMIIERISTINHNVTVQKSAELASTVLSRTIQALAETGALSIANPDKLAQELYRLDHEIAKMDQERAAGGPVTDASFSEIDPETGDDPEDALAVRP